MVPPTVLLPAVLLPARRARHLAGFLAFRQGFWADVRADDVETVSVTAAAEGADIIVGATSAEAIIIPAPRTFLMLIMTYHSMSDQLRPGRRPGRRSAGSASKTEPTRRGTLISR